MTGRGTEALADAPPSVEIHATRRDVDERLAALFPVHPGASLVEKAIADAARAPGKRLRPLIAILGARDLGWSGPALDVGCALELVHTASLVLDDLPCMDDAATRRGRPALHVAYGEDVATLAAIALLTRAYALAAAAPGLSAEQRVEAVAILSEAVGTRGLVGGQLDDLRGDLACAGRASAVNERKTGALFVAAARLACVMARSPEECRRRFSDFGRHLGHAFQIQDDLLDLEGDPAAMGKPKGKDAGKPTLVRLLGAAEGAAQLRQRVADAARSLRDLPGGGLRVGRLFEMTFKDAVGPAPC
jgi:geranylgeranyl diphosphate synthase, type II